jgi:hypothetical protein
VNAEAERLLVVRADVQIDAIWKFAAERLESIRKQPLK